MARYLFLSLSIKLIFFLCKIIFIKNEIYKDLLFFLYIGNSRFLGLCAKCALNQTFRALAIK